MLSKRNKRRIKTAFRRLKPFKGTFAYEIQVGPWLFAWRHDGQPWDAHNKTESWRTFKSGGIWYDKHWRR